MKSIIIASGSSYQQKEVHIINISYIFKTPFFFFYSLFEDGFSKFKTQEEVTYFHRDFKKQNHFILPI